MISNPLDSFEPDYPRLGQDREALMSALRTSSPFDARKAFGAAAASVAFSTVTSALAYGTTLVPITSFGSSLVLGGSITLAGLSIAGITIAALSTLVLAAGLTVSYKISGDMGLLRPAFRIGGTNNSSNDDTMMAIFHLENKLLAFEDTWYGGSSMERVENDSPIMTSMEPNWYGGADNFGFNLPEFDDPFEDEAYFGNSGGF